MERKRSVTCSSLSRPVTAYPRLSSLADEASRFRAFVPPFRFTSFFSPEDTLLCVCASEAALSRARSLKTIRGTPAVSLRIAELTSGSGLVGLYLLRIETGSTLLGLDIDADAAEIAAQNAEMLGLSDRARFERADLWSPETTDLLARWRPHLLVCNPPYVPEPPGNRLEIEAGSGPDGTAHLRRTLEIAARLRPRSIALSWCSLSDPQLVVRSAVAAGYQLNSLFVTAIADGEYSGSVHEYLRGLPHAFINEQKQTLNAVAPDESARFAYLLMAGEFSRREREKPSDREVGNAVEGMCERFAKRGIETLVNPRGPIPIRTWLLDRWDELRLRALLHGAIDRMASAPA